MTLPEYTQVRYARPPLKLVVCQMRFPSLLRISDPLFVADFQEAIDSEYPELQREQQSLFQMSSSGLPEASHVMMYRFLDGKGAWSVLLGESSLTLESRVYSSIDDLLRRFERVATAARDTLGVSLRQRLGLRYLNEFRHPEKTALMHWRDDFRAEFLGFAASLFKEPVGHTLQQVQVLCPDGNFVVRHGVMRGTTVPPLSASTNESEGQDTFYLLDLDYSDSRQAPLDIAASQEQLRAYNAFIYRFFRWTLSERHHVALEPQDAHRE